MYITSKEYKTEQKEQLRNENYVYIYLGLISKEAQGNATAEGTFTAYSSPQEVNANVPFEAYYETAEQNFARCDGSQYFLPRSSDFYGLYQGAVTADALGAITFTFGDYHRLNLKGLTINFGDFYPTNFTITNGNPNNTYTYTNTKPGQWKCEDEFLNTEYITITPHSMIGGQQKLRILSILFGMGLTFDNYNIISTSWKSEVYHLSDSLPSKTFTFTIDNLSRNYSADNPHSILNFLQEQQEVEFEYGRKMNDDSIYIIPGGKLSLKSWSSTDTQAKLTAVGNLDYITTTYYRGQFYPQGISLYDLAVDVFRDAGITNYTISSYLKRIITHNPLPVETHKNLIQLIAHAARCVLYEDRDGTVTLQTSFMPSIADIKDTGHAVYSDNESILESQIENYEYATSEKDFSATDAHQYFISRSDPFKTIGFVSDKTSNSSGEFDGVPSDYLRFVTDNDVISGIEFIGDIETSNAFFSSNGIEVNYNEEIITSPKLTLIWEAAWTFYNLQLVFSDVCPSEIIIYSYSNGVLTNTINVTDVSMNTLVEEAFYNVDRLTIAFVKTSPYQHIHLGKIFFGDITDYAIEYSDMSAFPTATKVENVKNINVIYSAFNYGTERKDIGTINDVAETNTVTYKNNAYHDYSLKYKELTDDEETYTKVSKVFCTELPPADSAKSGTRYFVTHYIGYDVFVVKSENNAKVWESLGTVTESIVDELPSTLLSDVLYLVTTDTEYIYHLYMKDETSEPAKTISLGYDVKGTLNIVDSGAYFVSFTSNVASPVVVSAIAFIINEQTYVSQVNEIGQDKTANNVLIDNIDLAKEEAEWMADYYANDIEYKIQYRGEPALDPDDQIYLENKFVEKNLIRITSTQIDTSTGMSMSCNLNARRISYQEV